MEWFRERPEVTTAIAFASILTALYVVVSSMKKKETPPSSSLQKPKGNVKDRPQTWNRPKRSPPAATTIKPQRDVKDFATDFELTESTMNEAFSMSPKLKSRGQKSMKQKKKIGSASSDLQNYDSEYVLEELSPDVPSQRHLVSDNKEH